MNTMLISVADEQDVTGFNYYPYLGNPFIFPAAQGLAAGNRLPSGDVSAGSAREAGPQVNGRAAYEGVFMPLVIR